MIFLVSAIALIGACACRNGVSDIRRRERNMNERKKEERLLEQEEQKRNQKDVDPDFTLKPDEPCPDFPNVPKRVIPNGEDQEDGSNLLRRKKVSPVPKPAPYPLPHD